MILFILRVATFPVNEAKRIDPKFKLLLDNKTQKFWEYHEKQSGIQMSKEFKELVTSMMEPMAELRPDLADIIASPWMQGNIATHDEVIGEM